MCILAQHGIDCIYAHELMRWVSDHFTNKETEAFEAACQKPKQEKQNF